MTSFFARKPFDKGFLAFLTLNIAWWGKKGKSPQESRSGWAF